MANFSELTTKVERRVIDLPSAVSNESGDLVNYAMRTLQDRHNFKVMEALSSEYTTTANSRVLASVPSDFKDYRGKPYMVDDTGHVRSLLVSHDRNACLRTFGNDSTDDTGEPQVLLDAEPDKDLARSWEVFPYPDGNSDHSDGEYRIYVPYWKYLSDLSGSTDKNWFTDRGEHYLIYKAVAHAFALNWDEDRAAVWEQLAAVEYDKLLMLDKKTRLGALDTIVPHTGAAGPNLGF